ncbi:MAG TPA: lysophospholipid acyltransferase family protein [Myxococcota bacterium]|nr:lysophospholipid acyltransferase family protein [Myxococcota bacterium]
MIGRLPAPLRTALAMGAIAADTLWAAPAAMILGATLGSTHRAVSGVYRDYARLMLAVCGAELRVRGEDRLDPDTRYVFVSNHSSHLDALAILAALPRHGLRFVAKKELGRIPLFGTALRTTGNVMVERTDARRDLATLDAAQRDLLRHISVLFFAEGTRSEDGKLHAFKKGAAAFALKAQLPLVPIGVAGTHAILPRGLAVGAGGPVGVCFGAPIPTDGRGFEERDVLTDELRASVAREMARADALRRKKG